MKKIPLIIPVFNQLTYLKNLMNWWRWYHPDAEQYPIFICDNGSTNENLISNYDHGVFEFMFGAKVYRYKENSFIPNVRDLVKEVVEQDYGFEYYVISDPDIMPHPSTPMNFLEIFKETIDHHGFHRAGFGLIIKDLPETLNERAMIIHNESELLAQKDFDVVLEQGIFCGYKAPIDTTFCLYKTTNGGWSAPMEGKDWGNCVRMFEAFHLGWYIDGDKLNPEMKTYFETSKYRVPGEPSAGKNNNRPKNYQ